MGPGPGARATDDADLTARLRALFEAARPAGVLAAWLFGSHAEGRAHRESDVDVGVLLDWGRYPDAEARFEARLRLFAWLAGALREARLDLVVLNDLPPLFGRRIVNHGRRVFCRDVPGERAFRVQVQLRAADLEPFLRRMRGLKLEALRR